MCDAGYEFTDDTSTDVIYCNYDNQWTSLTKTCQIISCPSFTVTNGNVTFTSLEYEGNATVTCEPGTWTEDNSDTMTLQCQANKTWTMIPTCNAQNLKKQSQRFSSQVDTVRDATDTHTQMNVRSGLDCASLCTADYLCMEANYKQTSPSVGGVCRLFNDPADISDLSSETGWHYMQKDQD